MVGVVIIANAIIDINSMLILLGTHIGGILVYVIQLVLILLTNYICIFFRASFRLDECTPNDQLPFRFTPQLFFVFLLPP